MPKQRKWHGKRGGRHSTAIQAAWRFLPAVIAEPAVNRITLGYITSKGSATGRSSLKIIEDKGSILLSVRAGSAHQEIRVFANDVPQAKRTIERAARSSDFHVSFGSRL